MTTGDTDRERALDTAVLELRDSLGEVRAIHRCAGCANFLDVVEQALADLSGLDSPVAVEVRATFAEWLAGSEERVRVRQFCEVCVPSGPYGRFRDAVCRDDPTRFQRPARSDQREAEGDRGPPRKDVASND